MVIGGGRDRARARVSARPGPAIRRDSPRTRARESAAIAIWNDRTRPRIGEPAAVAIRNHRARARIGEPAAIPARNGRTSARIRHIEAAAVPRTNRPGARAPVRQCGAADWRAARPGRNTRGRSAGRPRRGLPLAARVRVAVVRARPDVRTRRNVPARRDIRTRRNVPVRRNVPARRGIPAPRSGAARRYRVPAAGRLGLPRLAHAGAAGVAAGGGLPGLGRAGSLRPGGRLRIGTPAGLLRGTGGAEVLDPAVVVVVLNAGHRVFVPAAAAAPAALRPASSDRQRPTGMRLAGLRRGGPVLVVLGGRRPQILLVLRPSRGHEARYS